MAEWQYRIERVELETDPDSQLENLLRENGKQGWELVQVLPGQPARLIFKAEKPLD